MNKFIAKYTTKYAENTIILLLLFGITYMQYRYIGFYHDDYGYASISYGLNSSFGEATFGNILRYLWWHYLTIGGRVLYFFFAIAAMQLGMSGFMLLQSIINTGILFLPIKHIA